MGFFKRIFKGVKKVFKSVVKGIKKIVRSPIFKVALIAAAIYFTAGAATGAAGAAGGAGAVAPAAGGALSGGATTFAGAAGGTSLATGTAGAALGAELGATAGLGSLGTATAGLNAAAAGAGLGAASGAGVLGVAAPSLLAMPTVPTVAPMQLPTSIGADIASAGSNIGQGVLRQAGEFMLDGARNVGSFIKENPTAALLGGQMLQGAFTPSEYDTWKDQQEWQRRNNYVGGVNFYGTPYKPVGQGG